MIFQQPYYIFTRVLIEFFSKKIFFIFILHNKSYEKYANL